jgi:hypothetical protein
MREYSYASDWKGRINTTYPAIGSYPNTQERTSEVKTIVFDTTELNAQLNRIVIELADLKKSINSVNAIQILDLNSDKYKLKHPLSLSIIFENGEYVVEAFDFDIYGQGESEKEALESFKSIFIDYYENLHNSKKLSKLLISKRISLQQYIDEI